MIKKLNLLITISIISCCIVLPAFAEENQMTIQTTNNDIILTDSSDNSINEPENGVAEAKDTTTNNENDENDDATIDESENTNIISADSEPADPVFSEDIVAQTQALNSIRSGWWAIDANGIKIE